MTQKEVADHEKELKRRATLPAGDRAKLGKEDNEKALKKKLEAASLVDPRLKKQEKAALEIQDLIDALASRITAFTEENLKIYQMLFNPDVLFNDSPLSQFIINSHLRRYMIKRDMDFIGYVLDGKHTVQPFAEMVAESSKWAIRFTTPPQPKKTGIDSIIGGKDE